MWIEDEYNLMSDEGGRDTIREYQKDVKVIQDDE